MNRVYSWASYSLPSALVIRRVVIKSSDRLQTLCLYRKGGDIYAYKNTWGRKDVQDVHVKEQ